tara:strand:+ start:11663 stop:14296 length:2634 start_codon:yes stop_codon:yes gene_type:complete
MLNSLKKVFVNSFSRVKEKSLSYIRKPSFVLFSILFSVFFYNLLVKERFVLPKIDEDIVTLDLKYFASNFDLVAKRGIEKAGNRFLYGMVLDNEKGKVSAGYAYIKNEKDLIFKQGVSGENETWTFKSDEARYIEEEGDTVFSLFGSVDTYNKKKEIRIKSDNFRLSNNLTKLKLRGNVVIEDNDVKLFSEVGDYDENTGDLSISDSVAVELVADGEKIRIETLGLEYNSETNEAFTEDDFKMFYKDLEINGKGFVVKNKDFVTYNSVTITSEGETHIFADNLKYVDNVVKLEQLEGKYKGNPIASNIFEQENGKTVMKGNVILSDSDNTIQCDNLVTEDIVKATGSVVLTSKDFTLTSEDLSYDENNKVLKAPQSVINRDKDVINCSSLEYFEKDESGTMTDMVLVSEGRTIKAKDVRFNISEEKYELENNVEILGDYIVKPNALIIDKNIYLADYLEVIDDKTVLTLTNCRYDSDSGDFVTKDRITGMRDDYRFETEGLSYNSKSKDGILEGAVLVENPEDKFEIRSNSAKIEDDILIMQSPQGIRDEVEFSSDLGRYDEEGVFAMSGNFVAEKKDFKAISDEVRFDVKRNILSFETEADIYTKEMFVNLQKGNIAVDDEQLNGEAVVVTRDNGDILKADFIEASRELEVVNAQGNVFGDLEDKDIEFKSDKGRIFFISKDEDRFTRAELNSSGYFNKDELTVKADFIEYDNGVEKKDIEMLYARDNLKITIELPEGKADMTSRYAFYDLNREIGRMKRDVVITAHHIEHGSINAKADEALHDKSANIVNLKKNVSAKGTKSDLKIEGDDIEFDMSTFMLRGRGKAGFTYNLDKGNMSKEEKEVADEFIEEYEEDIESIESIMSEFNSGTDLNDE